MAYISAAAFHDIVIKDTAKSRLECLRINTKRNVTRLDMATGLAGIARVVKKGEMRSSFEIKQDFRNLNITFIGTELNDTDLGILLSVILLGQKHYCKKINLKTILHDQNHACDKKHLPLGRNVVGLITNPDDKNNEALDQYVIEFETTFSAIFAILDLNSDGEKNYAQTRKSLLRIASITSSWHNNLTKKGGIARLLSGNWNGDKLNIVLSYRLVEALLSALGKKSSFANIQMNVFNALPKGAAKILYVWLASWFGGSYGKREIGEEKIIQHAYGLTESSLKKLSKNELKKKKWVCREAMKSITEKSQFKNHLVDGVFEVTRESARAPGEIFVY